jgi:para-nitrobenzyl esterase
MMGEPDEQSADGRGWRWIPISIGVVVVLAGIGLFSVLRIVMPIRESPVQIADVSSERLLPLGSVVGFAADHETHAWLGIPYARPPVGELRWRAPQEPEAWADTLDALAFGPPCVQLRSRFGGVDSDDPAGLAGSEDCLYLNVWAPRSEPDRVATMDQRRPVMIWIHGGGNRIGHSGSPLYDGARLAGTEDIVLVSFNYRLGPFGWFSHPALRSFSGDEQEASGNFGTLDQIRALEWVQANIAEFGGDPDNVTIFGESAGGRNVLALLLVDAAKGLFHRAIAQSGSTDSISRGEAENDLGAEIPGQRHSSAEIVVSLLEQAGVVPDREAARSYAEALPESDVVSFIRGRSAREIVDAYRNPDRPGDLEVPGLIRDGALLPIADWLSEYRAGRFHRVPVMLGSNRDEMKLFLSQNEELVRRRFGVIYRIRDLEDYERRSRYHSDLWTVRAVARPAFAIADSGFSDVFAYRFDWDGLPRLFGVDLAKLLGAAHGFEIPFVFGNFDGGTSALSRMLFSEESAPAREDLSARMMGYWAEFARHGRPGRGGRGDHAKWLPWTSSDTHTASESPTTPRSTPRPGPPTTAKVLVFDAPDDGGIRLVDVDLSRDHVIAAVDAEPDLDQHEKCELFLDLFSSRPDWNVEEYRRIGRRGCAEYPPGVTLR